MRWYRFWEESGYFNADPNPDKKPHTIMMPLPNVTGALHMGHALNDSLQDLLTRWRRMQGYEALWMKLRTPFSRPRGLPDWPFWNLVWMGGRL